ncbi:FAD-binding oxidoreductase [Lutimaribacter sp. EGI FJ00015]|uniref:FAD-binding oxidoreductase n=1 Tax=Lutimaribacter degradans TaxID=2945989 RepID=A0ACC5ZT03_9RHOB|nr:FAD-dependent oxidoreductase [Lutimaribacter sp. EGI FJ00013]MCM2561473.1 FAD-binding oxidoreductase [Lutimaribacter sp. EGI FJ00013]MCO0612816.1 FAD-binding oxidoreductase [Lutimaribacter sp. EGI FJ00015]MCO0635474.1 FAD-binding oxidoreductase [Lutimaribacter sp. EGI FJ00014]
MQKHVIVVGAGIVGVATALWLQRGGAAVTLVDRDGPAAGASQGNAGLLAAAAVLPNSEPGLIRRAPFMALNPDAPLFLRWSYLPFMMHWLAGFARRCTTRETARIAQALAPLVLDSLDQHRALAAGTGAERHLAPCDYIYAYSDRAALEAAAPGWALRRDLGGASDRLEGAALAEYDPLLARFACAMRMGGHGRISDPQAYVTELARHFESQGGRILRAEATGIAREGARVAGLRTGETVLACDDLVLCAGAWSGPLMRDMGLRVPLESERGYHLELWGASTAPRAPTMVAAGQFVVTPMTGRVRLAGIVELGGLRAGPSRAPLSMLRRALARNFPELRWDRQTTWMGHRPSTPDSLPVIGPVLGLAGAWVGVGHQHVGLTSGPVTGRWLAQMVLGQRPNVDMAAYAPGRFA